MSAPLRSPAPAAIARRGPAALPGPHLVCRSQPTRLSRLRRARRAIRAVVAADLGLAPALLGRIA